MMNQNVIKPEGSVIGETVCYDFSEDGLQVCNRIDRNMQKLCWRVDSIYFNERLWILRVRGEAELPIAVWEVELGEDFGSGDGWQFLLNVERREMMPDGSAIQTENAALHQGTCIHLKMLKNVNAYVEVLTRKDFIGDEERYLNERKVTSGQMLYRSL